MTVLLPTPPPYRILDAGEGGLVVEFGTVVDTGLNRLVTALDARVAAEGLVGVVETVPTYRSLLVILDPLAANRRDLTVRLEAMIAMPTPDEDRPARRWRVPVAYGGALGEDLDHVAALHDMTAAEVARRHAEAEYRVVMIGFAPGFAYLGGLPEALHTPRRTDPRPRTPAGSISIGGVQAAISSVEVPSGWHLLGRTPLRTFDLARPEPFLLRPGDAIRFHPVSPATFERLAALSARGEITAEREDAA